MEQAFLWGFLTAALRYLPYVGVLVAAVPSVLVSFAVFHGWGQPLMVLGLFVALELVTANFVEPRLYGRSMGVSEVGLLIVAAFWAFLWGPIGLLLSSPLTICLVVIGKYVPQFEFLNVLLGDEPVLGSDVIYYQRLLARDQDEATELVLTQTELAPEQVYDELLIPALSYARRDREREQLSQSDEEFFLQATREIVEDLGERRTAGIAVAIDPALEPADRPAVPRVRLLACPCRGETDALALEMLRQLLDPSRWEVEIASIDMLSSEIVDKALHADPPVICIGSVPPGGLARTRYLCKRLRAQLPQARIVVGRWGQRGDDAHMLRLLEEAGADQVETTLLGTRNHLNAWLPSFVQQAGKVAEAVSA